MLAKTFFGGSAALQQSCKIQNVDSQLKYLLCQYAIAYSLALKCDKLCDSHSFHMDKQKLQ